MTAGEANWGTFQISATTLSTSIGIAFYHGEDLDAEQVIHHADTALYLAKQRGRARYQVHAPPENEAMPAASADLGT